MVTTFKKHGRDISTLKVWKFERQEVCTRFALWFSRKFNIVQSEEYANLVEERGYDGCGMVGELNGMFGKTHSVEAKQKISIARNNAPTKPYCGELNGMYGKTGNQNPMFGKPHTEDALIKMRKPKSIPRKIIYCICCHRGISINAFGQHLRGKQCLK